MIRICPFAELFDCIFFAFQSFIAHTYLDMNSRSASDPESGDDTNAAETPQEDASSHAFNDGCEDLSDNKEFDAFWEYLMQSKNSDFRLKLSSKHKSSSGPWFHRYNSKNDES